MTGPLTLIPGALARGSSFNRNNLDFNLHVLGKLCNLDCRACGKNFTCAECFGINTVHGNEIIHVLQEYCCLHNVREVCSCLGKHCGNVFEALSSLLCGTSLEDGTCLRYDGNLS